MKILRNELHLVAIPSCVLSLTYCFANFLKKLIFSVDGGFH